MGKKHRRPPTSPLQEAISLHRAGQMSEAERHYRQLKDSSSQARQLFGVLLFQTGRREEGLQELEGAVESDPTNSEALGNLGVVYHELGRYDEAMGCLDRALAMKPVNADFHDKRGFVLQDLNRHDEAIDSFRKALELAPDHAEAWFHLGWSLLETGRNVEALEACERAVQFRPMDADAWTNFGNALLNVGRAQDSVAAHRKAVDLSGSADAYSNYAAALSACGSFQHAIDAQRMAIQIQPANSMRRTALGQIHAAASDTVRAIGEFKSALEVHPSDGDARRKLALALSQTGAYSEALDTLQDQTDAASLMVRAMLSPVIPESVEQIVEARSRIRSELMALEGCGKEFTDPNRQVGVSHFYWAYHTEPEVELTKLAARAYQSVCPSLFWQSPHLGEASRGKVRLGVASALLKKHTIGKLFRRVVEGLPNADLELVFLNTGRDVDEWTEGVASRAAQAFQVPQSLKDAREMIAGLKLDAMFYPEIGMDTFTYYLAFSNLAPLQFTTWGHPVSTGMPSMDAFLSCPSFEVGDTAWQYGEELVKLRHISTNFELPEAPLATRQELGLAEGAHLYVCPQTLFKFHPKYDSVFAEILSRDSNAEILLVEGSEPNWQILLERRFADSIGKDSERIRFLPRLDQFGFLNLCRVSDVVLDPFPFGGGTTSLEAFAMGAAIPTLRGNMLRSNITPALYDSMEMPDLIASDPTEYIELALKLGTDRDFRESMHAKIRDRSPVLFGRTEPAEEIRAFVLERTRK